MRVLRRPGLLIGQVGNVTLKIAMLVTLRNSRALHHPRRALLHPAIARHRHAARRAISARHQLPTRPSTQRAILQSHSDSIRLLMELGKPSTLGKLWKELLMLLSEAGRP